VVYDSHGVYFPPSVNSLIRGRIFVKNFHLGKFVAF
jgi:hypothetical protein